VLKPTFRRVRHVFHGVLVIVWLLLSGRVGALGLGRRGKCPPSLLTEVLYQAHMFLLRRVVVQFELLPFSLFSHLLCQQSGPSFTFSFGSSWAVTMWWVWCVSHGDRGRPRAKTTQYQCTKSHEKITLIWRCHALKLRKVQQRKQLLPGVM
jgi:hypothetical protein